MAEVLLTADRTLMSNYHNNEFLGFGTCAPPNFIPEWFYSFLFFPPIKANNGVPSAAPYGLRKTEAQLLKEGFNVVTISPDHLEEYINEAKVVGIHTMDPFGLGPASSTLAAIFKKEPYLAKYFHTLMNNPAVKKAKKRGLKIIIGGPGAWQFRYRQKFVKEHGIDCVVEGEAENVIGKIFKAAVNGEDIPEYYEVSIDETPDLGEIPDIVQPSINGLVEIGRGCCRGCDFCNVTLRPLRWCPYEKIQREINVNNKSGKVNSCCLHAEDVMLYGSKNTLPNEEKLTRLHEFVVKNCDGISWSHCSLAAVASNPKVFSKIAEMITQKQSWWGAEVGIETGSPEIARKIMPAKAHPFKAEEWPEVVRTGMGIMHDNKLVPACTLIVGLPEEKEEDVIKTMELLDDLKNVRSLIVPLFFVPLGKLKSEDWFRNTEMTELHKQLLFQCVEHDFYWVDNLIELTFKGKWYQHFLREFYKGFSGIAKRKVRQIEISALP
ncbi:B12-binding domain-containing radical SAM protein [Candidatus Bathyarchaeota archaeon]|nr:B12-binding domain-containing radical SAM protein [Candidatus Bathyarchaeota archaeon]